jgi:colanic acid/amylovoran biosynthesis protein
VRRGKVVNIVIVNFGSTLNKGSAAILSGNIKLLANLFSDTKFTVLTFSWGYPWSPSDSNIKIDKVIIGESPRALLEKIILSILLSLQSVATRFFGLNVNISVGRKNLQEYADIYTSKMLIVDSLSSFAGYFLLLYCSFLAVLRKFGLNIDKLLYPKKLWVYFDADLILNTGGDVLTEDYGTALSYFSNLLFGLLLDKPIVICAESIGPFNKKVNKLVAKYILNRAKLITLREERSLKHLQGMGVNKPPIYVTADVAFTLEAASDQKINEILVKEGITEHRPLVGISVSKIISNYGFPAIKNPNDKYNEYVKLMSNIVDYLVNTLNATIVFVPHVYGPIDTDDRVVADDICKLIKNKHKVVSIKEEYTPEELKGIIGQCDLFIGARMHATIASTSMFVPTVGIAYSHKMYGIIGEMLGQEKYIIDIKELNYESLISKINDAWENREKIRKGLEVKIPMVKEKAMLNGELVKELLDSLKAS